MDYSLSFLATQLRQLPEPGLYGNSAVEATLFTNKQLENKFWQNAWMNVEHACHMYGPHNVTFHFPMNDSDYSVDRKIYKKLQEAYSRASDLGLNGVVVHSNRITTSLQWQKRDFDTERIKILNLLLDIKNTKRSKSTWLGLENMPLVGNHGTDTDPLYSSPNDFLELPDEIGVVWDVCHAISSEYFAQKLREGDMPEYLFGRTPDSDSFSPSIISDKIVHWHFAAFKGYNDGLEGQCQEGLLPQDSDVDESRYKDALVNIAESARPATINFEVVEDDYSVRKQAPRIITWSNKVLNV